MGGGGPHKVTPHGDGDASGLESLAGVRRHLLLCRPDPPAGTWSRVGLRAQGLSTQESIGASSVQSRLRTWDI